MAVCCLTYLQYHAFEKGWDGFLRGRKFPDWNPEGIRIDLTPPDPFAKYAAKFWASHVSDYGLQDGKEKLLNSLRNDSKVSSTARVLLAHDHTIRGYGFTTTKPVSALQLLAYLGADEMIAMLLKLGFKADMRDARNVTPLWWAAHGG